jgi:hypothetical protein
MEARREDSGELEAEKTSLVVATDPTGQVLILPPSVRVGGSAAEIAVALDDLSRWLERSGE